MHNEALIHPVVYTDTTGHTATLIHDQPYDRVQHLVLRLDGPEMDPHDYAPEDLLPTGMTAAGQVARCAPLMDEDTRHAAVEFLHQWPEGPQI